MRFSRIASLVAPPLCVGCGEHAGESEPLCRDCRLALQWLGHDPAGVGGIDVWAPLAYEGPARALVGALKYRGALPLAVTMAAQVAVNAPPSFLERGTLVPVPLHPARRRSRGFNQAELLASALASRGRLGCVDCLERTGAASTQVGRGRADRLEAIEDAISLRRGPGPPLRAILVDDVVTTGATLAACAGALRRAGATHVSAVAYARTRGR